MLMSVFIDFDDLSGYTIRGTASVEAVIDSIVKLDNGQRFDLYESVEYIVNELDEVLLLDSVHTSAAIRSNIDEVTRGPWHSDEGARASLIESLSRMLASVEQSGGRIELHNLVINDEIYDATLRG